MSSLTVKNEKNKVVSPQDINITMNSNDNSNTQTIGTKESSNSVPQRKKIHCADGVLYEDELVDSDVDDEKYDWLEYMTLEGKPEEMTWAKWALYKAGRATGHTLKYMDSWGESLADDFGLNKDPYKELIDRHNELFENEEAVTGLGAQNEDPVENQPKASSSA